MIGISRLTRRESVVFTIILLLILVVPVSSSLVSNVNSLPSNSIVSFQDSTARYFYFNSILKSTTVVKFLNYNAFVFDKTSRTIRTISTDKDDNNANAVSFHAFGSSDGSIAVFQSWATNLVTEKTRGSGVYVKTITTGDIKLIEPNALFPVISGDGKWVVYENLNYDGLPAMIRYEVSTGNKQFIDYTSLGNTKGGWMSQTPTISSDGINITYITTKSGHPERYSWIDGVIKKMGDVTV